jgi:type I restriction enzyme S subunit
MMKESWESISFADLISERKDRFEPDAPEIMSLPKIEKIDFSEGKLHLGEYEATKTQQIIVEPGDFVFSGLNIEKGAAGFNETGSRLVVSANYSTCHFDDSRVSLDFFKHYMRSANFQSLLKANLKKDYGFTRPKHLMPLTFLVPRDKAEQDRIVSNFERCKNTHAELSHEITHQETLLAKLKQAILQEAIAGKLTADWRAAHPDVEPASQLLHRIQAEKARLIAAKKLRPEKPLPQITSTEIPFEIPQGWEWCRFGQLTRAYEAGSSFKCEDREVVGDEWGVIKTSAVTSGEFAERENKFLQAGAPSDTSAQVAVGDLIFCRASGSKGLAGKCAIVRECSRNLLLSDKTIRVPLMEGISQEFVALHNDSAQAKAYFASLGMGKSTSMNNVTRDELFMKPVPLPPLAEQAAIVERVEALMEHCRALAAEIEHTRTHAAHLLQAVLKEAFAPASTPH